MTNLIVTILSIALAAIIVAFGLYYVSDNFGKNMAQIRANTIKNEASQIYAAANQYMVDNGLSNFNAFKLGQLYQNKYLSTPAVIAGIPTAMPPAGNAYANTCLDNANPSTWDGQAVNWYVVTCAINGVNVVTYTVKSLNPYPGSCYTQSGDFTSASSATHPVVQMCLALNAKASLPAGLTYAASGIPYAADGSPASCHPDGYGQIFSGSNKFGYCYIYGTSGTNTRLMVTFAN